MPDPTLPALTGAAQALSKPVCKLVDAIRDGAGVLYEPTKIRKKALAEADATLIYTQAEIDQSDLLRRAAFRVASRSRGRLTRVVGQGPPQRSGGSGVTGASGAYTRNGFRSALFSAAITTTSGLRVVSTTIVSPCSASTSGSRR